MSSRIIAIGDIHGHSLPLQSLIKAIKPTQTDTIITLGDYIDRGPDSKGVIDLLLELRQCCNLITILGNHEEVMLISLKSNDMLREWFGPPFHGDKTLMSYGIRHVPTQQELEQAVPPAHWLFLADCVDFYETEKHFFAHANYDPDASLENQIWQHWRWERNPVGQHKSGKKAVVGHTPQVKPKDDGFSICIDTGCGHGGILTAYDIKKKRIWQANENGKLLRNASSRSRRKRRRN